MKFEQFKAAMRDLAALYDRDISKPMMDAWWKRFERCHLSDFRAALEDACVDAGFFPGYGHVKRHLRRTWQEREELEIEARRAGQREPLPEPKGFPPDLRARLAAIFGKKPPAEQTDADFQEQKRRAREELKAAQP